jgi:hypothetical protein
MAVSDSKNDSGKSRPAHNFSQEIAAMYGFGLIKDFCRISDGFALRIVSEPVGAGFSRRVPRGGILERQVAPRGARAG